MKRVAILGGGEGQLPVLSRANDRGLYTVVIDPDPQCVCAALASRFVALDLGDVASCRSVAAEAAVDAVLTFAADYPVVTAAELAADLGLAGPSVEAVSTTTDKQLLGDLLATAGVSSPAMAPIDAADDIAAFAAAGSCPTVVKPAHSSGSRGVTVLSPADVLDRGTSRAAFDWAASFGDGRVLAETFVAGQEVSVEGVAVEGSHHVLAVTDKHLTPLPYRAEIGHDQPSRLETHVIAEVEKLVSDAVAAVGLDNCATHTEVILGTAGPTVIEMAARFGGGFISSHLLKLSLGIDAAEIALSLALGEPPVLVPETKLAASIRFIVPTSGEIMSIDGVNEARNMPGVRELYCGYEVGDLLNPIRTSTNRNAYVIASGSDTAEAAGRCNDAAAAVRIATS